MRIGYPLGLAFLLLCGFAAVAAADEPSDQFKDARQQCNTHIADLRSSARDLQVAGIVVATLGGLGAAVSGLKAGNSDGAKGKRWGVVALISGIAAAAAPHIPNAQSYQDKVTMADRQRITGLKVERQLPLLDDPAGGYKRECAQYVLARYTDCVAEETTEPPDLPVNSAASVANVAPQPNAPDTASSPLGPMRGLRRGGGAVRKSSDVPDEDGMATPKF
jgi:hypothetical protein